MEESKGFIYSIYRGTTHDGPGMRYSTVFFKGCPLSCEWCHNPESISLQQRVWWESKKCIGCLSCVKACQQGAISAQEQGLVIDQSKCELCGACVKACPTKSMTFIGEHRSLESLVAEMIKDKAYYDQTGGGVTASGGEPMMQHEFVISFFKELHKNGIHTALDTSGMVPYEFFEKILPHTDCLLYDLKIFDEDQHKRYTGKSNTRILANIEHIVQNLEKSNPDLEIWIRTPLIPGVTATVENIKALGEFIANKLTPQVTRWELCSFNNSCTGKYLKLGKEWAFKNAKLLNRETTEQLWAAAIAGGIDKERVLVTGLVTDE